MEPITTTTIRTIAVGSLNVIDLDSESASDVGGGTDDERQSVNDVEGFDDDVEAEDIGISQENDNKEGMLYLAWRTTSGANMT